MNLHQTEEWEDDCIKTRRWIWLRKRRLGFFKINRNDRVLDLGCGDGLNIQILREWGIKNIVGVDISKKLLKLAKENNPDVTFILAPAEKLPFKTGKFDFVLADSVFHHLVHFPQSISEIQRVLQPGGSVCFIDPHASFARRILDFATTSALSTVIPFLHTRKQAYLAEYDLIHHWLNNETKLLSLLEQNGLQKVFLKYDFFSVVGQYRKPDY